MNDRNRGVSLPSAAYAGRGDYFMCIKNESLALLFFGLGLGLLLSFALCGWFWRLLCALALLVAGFVCLR